MTQHPAQRLRKIADDLRAVALDLGTSTHGSILFAAATTVNTVVSMLALGELREAEAIDMRLRRELVGGGE